MPIPLLESQKKLREVGRIRLGDKSANGAPKRLDKFRLTTSDKAVLDYAATIYGGTVKPFNEPTCLHKWQLYIEADAITVSVTPVEGSLWYEDWAGGYCQHRCDGEWDSVMKTPCQCDPMQRKCKIKARYQFWLPDLPSISSWRLETSGYYAAIELPTYADLMRRSMEQGRAIPATLSLETRESKRMVPDGKGGMKAQKFIFNVPILNPIIQVGRLIGLEGYDGNVTIETAPQQAIEGQRKQLAGATAALPAAKETTADQCPECNLRNGIHASRCSQKAQTALLDVEATGGGISGLAES